MSARAFISSAQISELCRPRQMQFGSQEEWEGCFELQSLQLQGSDRVQIRVPRPLLQPPRPAIVLRTPFAS